MDISLKGISTGISRLLHRFHILLFSIFILGMLIVAVYLLNQLLITSDQANGYTAQANNASFDTATINRLNQLHSVTDPSTPLSLPAGRINPFTE